MCKLKSSITRCFNIGQLLSLGVLIVSLDVRLQARFPQGWEIFP